MKAILPNNIGEVYSEFMDNFNKGQDAVIFSSALEVETEVWKHERESAAVIFVSK